MSIEYAQAFRRTSRLAGLGRWVDRSGILGLRGFGVVPGPGTREALVGFLNAHGRSDLAALVTPTRNTTDPAYFNVFVFVLGPDFSDAKYASMSTADRIRARSASYLSFFPSPNDVRGVQAKGGLSQDGKLGPSTAAYLDKQLPDWKGRPWAAGLPRSILDAFGAVARAGGGGGGGGTRVTTAKADIAPAPGPTPAPGPVVEPTDGGGGGGRGRVVAAGFFSPRVLIVGGILLAAVAVLPSLLKRKPAASAA